MRERLLRSGIGLFNEGRFWDAHEVFEDLWRSTETPDRKLFRGLVQFSAALHHACHGNHHGVRTLVDRGLANTEGFLGHAEGFELQRLRTEMGAYADAYDGTAAVSGFPRFHGPLTDREEGGISG